MTEVGACCASCAVGAVCEADCDHHGHHGVEIGDLGDDILRGIATADQAFDRVWESVKDDVPFGEQIDRVHDARMRALEQHAPRYYPKRPGAAQPPRAPTAPAAPARPGAPGNLVRTVLDAQRRGASVMRLPSVARQTRAAMPAVLIAARVAAIRDLVRRAKDGDASARAEIRSIKVRAAGGDPQARREYKAAIILTDERPAKGTPRR